MGQAKLYGQKSNGMSINGIIKDYYAYAGENISAGDLVEYINGVAGKTDYGTSVDTQLSTETYTGYTISAVALDDNRVFIAHSYSANYDLWGIVVTINGAEITLGIDTMISDTIKTGEYISALKLDNGNVFIAHSYSGNYYLYGIICTIDGTTIIFGEDKLIVGTTSSYSGKYISALKLDNGNIFIAHNYGTSNYLRGIVVSISGTTITAGTDTALVSTNYAGTAISTCLLPNGNVFIAHSYGSNYYLYGIVCTISGTTITAGSDTQLSTTSYTGFIMSTVTLDKNRIFIAHSYSTSYHLYGIVCTIDGTTISKGTDTLLKNDSSEGATISTCLLPNGNIFIAHRYGTTAQNLFIYGLICGISGTTITAGTDTALISSSHAGFEISSLLLNSDTIFIAHYIDSSAYLYAQIFGIDYDNNIPTNNIIVTEYETQVRKVTTGQFDGVAKTSGLGAPEFVDKEVEAVKSGNLFANKVWTKISTTEYISEDGIRVKANSASSDSENLVNIFDENVDTSFTFADGPDFIIDIEFPKAEKITKMKFESLTSYAHGIIIYGSNDGDSWANLGESASYGKSHSLDTETELTNPDYYKFYRFEPAYAWQTYYSLYEWQVSEYIGTEIQQIPSTEHNDIVSIWTMPQSVKGNVFDKIWTKVSDLEYVAEDGTVLTGSGIDSTNNPLTNVIDGDISTYTTLSTGYSIHYVEIEFPIAIKILTMNIYLYCINKGITKILGSNNGEDWIELYIGESVKELGSSSGSNQELAKIELTNTDFYKYYRLHHQQSETTSFLNLYEWQTSEYIVLE